MKEEFIASKQKNLDDVLRLCGGFGRFHWFHCFFLNLFEVAAGLISFYYVFGAAEPEHRCRLPLIIWPNDNQYNPSNNSYLAYLRENIPMNDQHWDQCHLFNSTGFDQSWIGCTNGWTFNRDVFGYTFTEEASLVCADKPRKSWLSTVVQAAGILIVFIGPIADRFGRKRTIVGCMLLILLVCLTLQSIIQWVPMSINTKFVLLLINQFSAGAIISVASIAFVLMIEMTSSQYRSIAGNIALSSFAIGGMLITLFAYLTHHWQKLLWVMTIFIGIAYPYLYFMPESPLYLYSTKQYSKLENVLRRMAKRNGRSDSYWYSTYQEFLNSSQTATVVKETLTFKQTIRQLFYHRTHTTRLFIGSVITFVYMLLFIKISYGLATMNTSPYIGILIGAIVEIFGYIISSALMSTKLGRKYTLISATSLTCLCVLLVPILAKRSTIATVVISQLGKFSISASIATAWIFISELFPTSIRGSAIGIISAISRIGAIVAPIIDSSVNEQQLPITFYVYGFLAFLTLILIMILPETKNISLDKTEIIVIPSVNENDT